MSKVIVIKIEGIIRTDYSGIKKLYEFYNQCREFTNTDISIDFYQLEWIDANLCSLFESMLYKLVVENALNFSTDYNYLRKEFSVLFRNGFIKTSEIIEDHHKSCVKAQNFKSTDKKLFHNYINENLLSHSGMPPLGELESQVFDDLLEIFANYDYHANSTDPFFVAGQYYPSANKLKFTMVDIGDGFLKKINAVTNGVVDTHLKAINWALEGKSIKPMTENVSGGIGIKRIHEYCRKCNGELEIVTGDAYWSSTYSNTIFKSGRLFPDKNYPGTLINLTFQH